METQNQKYDDLIKEREYLTKFSGTLEEYREYTRKISKIIAEDNENDFKGYVTGMVVSVTIFIVICLVFKVFTGTTSALIKLLALFSYGAFMIFTSKSCELASKISRNTKYEAMDNKNALIGCNVIERLEEIEGELESLE